MEKFSKFQAVLFDVDGVLISSQDANGKFLWMKNIEKTLGINPKDMNGIMKPAISQGWIIGKANIEDIFTKELPKYGYGNVGAKNLISYWLKKDKNIHKDIFKFVAKLKSKKIKTYLASNQDSYRENYLWEELGFKNLFDGGYYSGRIGYAKPSEAFFLHVDKDLTEKGMVDPNKILFIDDRLENVEAAESVGWQGYHYQNWEKFKKDFKIE